MSIAVRTSVDAVPSAVFELVGDLDRHRELTDGGMRILRLHGQRGRRTGGLVELRGPLGVRRLAHTQVRGAEPHSRLWGTAQTSDGARATLDWRLRAREGRTYVEVRLDVRAAKWRDRLLLRLGGRAWLRSRLRAALDRLSQISTTPEYMIRPVPGVPANA